MRHILYLLTAGALATAVAAGCSSSSSVPVEDGGGDGQTDGGKTDGGVKPGKDGGGGKETGAEGSSPEGSTPEGSTPEGSTPEGSTPEGSTDSPTDGPCNFATFVKGLIANDTNGTAAPSANLGQSCTDDQKQSDFSSLFP
jgi:hypothetical protein